MTVVVKCDDPPVSGPTAGAAAKPEKPIEINLNANINELMVDYNQLIAQIQNNQRNIANRIDNIGRQFDGARERVVRKIIEENTRYMNIIRQSRKLKDEDKSTLITQLQTAVSTAISEVQTLGMTAQNNLRSNNIKANTEDDAKVINVVKDLQVSQGKTIETIMKSLTEVPSKMNSQWATVEKVLKDIDLKNK